MNTRELVDLIEAIKNTIEERIYLDSSEDAELAARAAVQYLLENGSVESDYE